MDFKDVKKNISLRLKELTVLNVYSIFKPKEGSYPCVIYKLPDIGNLGDPESNYRDQFLDVDFYSIVSEDEILAEADNVSDGLDFCVFNVNDGLFRTFLESSGEVFNDKEAFKFRIHQSYRLRNYKT